VHRGARLGSGGKRGKGSNEGVHGKDPEGAAWVRMWELSRVVPRKFTGDGNVDAG